jgi:hypothetical protein
MDYKTAISYFKQIAECHYEWSIDKPAIRGAFADLIDSWHKDGTITDKQAQNWCLPKRLNLYGKRINLHN